MHSRVSRFKVPADRIELAIRTMQERVDAGAQRHEAFAGFAGEMLLVDREGQEAVLIVYYQDKASMDSNAEAARQLRDQVVSGLGAEALLVNEYQIAVVDIPSPITTGWRLSEGNGWKLKEVSVKLAVQKRTEIEKPPGERP